MVQSSRFSKIIRVLLILTLFFWAGIVLFQFRITNFFDSVLMKLLGPYVLFGIMLLTPLLLLVEGVRNPKAPRRSGRRSLSVGMGLCLLGSFVVFIGVPLVLKALEPVTPKNPSVPRPLPPVQGLPVVPGLEGFGTRTPAGRGGKILKVTSLEDRGPGTLRAALDAPFPRIVVFDVGGTIELEEALYISHPYLTVAGQTAPGDGICLKNAGVVVTTHDVLLQHLRIWPGNQGSLEPDDNDAVALLGKHADVDGASHVVLDHVSAGWGEDETVSTWFGAHDITISWCIVSEALNRSRHRKTTHSAGLMIGDSSYHVSVHHTLLAHNDFRNPLIIEGGTHDFVNNVVYDWGVLPAEIVDYRSNSFVNFIGNTFLPGPSTQARSHEIVIGPGEAGIPKIYVEGNQRPDEASPPKDEWSRVGYGYGEGGPAPDQYRSLVKHLTDSITATDASSAYEAVLAQAGATAPRRDAVDQRIVSDVIHRTGAIIDSPDEVGGYPALSGGSPLPDTDEDGMPDEWETKTGLDPTRSEDGNEDRDGDGYTNLEVYLHSLRKADNAG